SPQGTVTPVPQRAPALPPAFRRTLHVRTRRTGIARRDGYRPGAVREAPPDAGPQPGEVPGRISARGQECDGGSERHPQTLTCPLARPDRGRRATAISVVDGADVLLY